MTVSRLFGAVVVAAVLTSGVYAQDVTQAELSSFVEKLKSCWTIAPDDVGSGRTVTLRVTLTPDGAVEQAEIVDPDKSAAGRRLAAGAIRAVERCAPYSFSAESFEQWKKLEIDLQP